MPKIQIITWGGKVACGKPRPYYMERMKSLVRSPVLILGCWPQTGSGDARVLSCPAFPPFVVLLGAFSGRAYAQLVAKYGAR